MYFSGWIINASISVQQEQRHKEGRLSENGSSAQLVLVVSRFHFVDQGNWVASGGKGKKY